jgi:hypothetical protein
MSCPLICINPPAAATNLSATYSNAPASETFTWTNGGGTSRALWYCDQTFANSNIGTDGQPIQCTRDGYPANATQTQRNNHVGAYFLATDNTSPVGPTTAPAAGYPLAAGHTYSWFIRETAAGCGAVDTDSTFIYGTVAITGQVYVDSNGNGVLDGAEVGKAGVTVTLSTGQSNITALDGTYTISNVVPGTYTESIALPSGYTITYPSPYPPTVYASIDITQNFGIQPPPTFSATGQVYVDEDKNGQINGSDHAYTNSALTLTICQGNQPGGCSSPFETLTTTISDGTFTTVGATALPSGSYTAILTLPSGYQAISPKPPIAVFTVGNAITGDICAPAAECDASGNIVNLNFGISNSFPWMQAIGGDILTNGFNDNIPATADLTCSGGAYASAVGAGGTPGVVNTGSGNANFGQGQASAQNWLVGGIGSGNYPYVYNMPLSNQTRTSYVNLSYLVRQSNIQTKSLSDYCGSGGLSDCTLPTTTDDFPSGFVYMVNADLTLDSPDGPGGSYTFPSGGKYTILVDGILTIKTKVLVPNGSFVLFSASDDINVASTVGDIYSSTTPNLEGYYSTDKSFNVQGKDPTGSGANCATNDEDLRLNVAGSIVVNAVTTNGGGFYYQRDMCASNLKCPVFTITERPDFVLNVPTFLMFPRRVWQEVAP